MKGAVAIWKFLISECWVGTAILNSLTLCLHYSGGDEEGSNNY